MANLTKGVFIPMVVWDAVIAVWIAGMHIWYRDMSVGPEERQALVFAFLTGCGVVLVCWLFCGMLHSVAGSLVGFISGLLIPVIAGSMWGQLPELFPGLSWSFIEGWGAGLQLAVPSGVAGIIVGLLQSKRAGGTDAPGLC